MEPEPFQDKSLDDVLEEVDWDKLGVEGVEDEAELSLPAKTEPSLAAKIEPAPAAKSEPSQRAKWEPSPPAHMELFRRGSDIEITRKWLPRVAGFVIAGATLVMWVAVPFVIKELLKRLVPQGTEAWAIIAGSLASALVLTYCALAGSLNRTHVAVSREKITVRHRPIPWVGYNEMEVSNLKQLYTKRLVSGGRGGTRVTYEVYAITSDERIRLLVGSLDSSEQAFFIEQQIEKYLGIKNVSVEGEFRRGTLGKDVAVDVGVAAGYMPRLERTSSAREIRDALLTNASTRQDKRHKSWHKQDLIELALNWHERGRPDSLQHADLTQADLRGAKLGRDEEGHPGANLSFANLHHAKLGGADLRGVDLYNANLSGAALEGANLEGANLYEVNFNGANLEGTNLVGARVIPDQLARAMSLKGAMMPDGTVHE